ncbi:hypothetical protein BAUCODRAFT_32441 [Baudoinia panamericana UAMH 10762]|uniref:Uncharacterized protein n=1 Tax=Baudoinia panamericana (strain UAMH 10762) TaxID=717646 RepID=M2NH97_BAUPA|nr:uncharacterized protein BAUCODRAFT_32441 [Baudoinia panamericana UAMH 10762]EMC98400.1 hypothetical protein BAUCODRAFT_32441 [Baudoinia panamericana UAMH 10762]
MKPALVGADESQDANSSSLPGHRAPRPSSYPHEPPSPADLALAQPSGRRGRPSPPILPWYCSRALMDALRPFMIGLSTFARRGCDGG